MLDSGIQRVMVEQVWDQLGCRVALPDDLAPYFEKEGPIQAEFYDRRQFRRFYFRRKAVVERKGELCCVYTKDVSRSGIVLLHAEQIFPCEHVRVFLSNGMVLQVEVRRCRRLRERCYECGARITDVIGAETT